MEYIRRFLFWYENRQGYLKLNRYCSKTTRFFSVLMYHGVENDDKKLRFRPYDMSEKAIKREIEFYLSQGYTLSSDVNVENEKESYNSKLMLSFDDGNRNISQTLQTISRQYNIRPILAICPGVIENQTPYWFEEVYARVLLAKDFKIHAACQNAQDADAAYKQIMAHYFSDCSLKSADLLSQIRAATPDIDSKQIAGHPAIHQNLDWIELKTLVDQNCCTIAVHTMHHDCISHMHRQEFADDVAQCKRLIKKHLNIDSQHFVYPFGNYAHDWETEVLSASGVNFSYAVENNLNISPKTNYRIKRITGKDISRELGYYRYHWHQRHAQLITLN